MARVVEDIVDDEVLAVAEPTAESLARQSDARHDKVRRGGRRKGALYDGQIARGGLDGHVSRRVDNFHT